MSKYPGSFIINEVGTAGDLATIYGVSERTIYRWLNKAAKESGIKPHKKHKTPRPSTLVNFKGTRKQLAKKYGVSESTVYRWIKNAKAGGTAIPSRRQMSKYPGTEILNITGTNKELAKNYGVSERTISRWKRRARLEQAAEDHRRRDIREPEQPRQETPEQITFDEIIEEPLTNVEPEIEEPWEVPEPDEEEPWEVPDYDYEADDRPEWEKLGISENMYNNLKDIMGAVVDLDLLGENSLYNNIPHPLDILYMNEYIEYQYQNDPGMFYDPVLHEERFDAEWVTQLPIWGEEFEYWLQEKMNIDNYEI